MDHSTLLVVVADLQIGCYGAAITVDAEYLVSVVKPLDTVTPTSRYLPLTPGFSR